MAEKQARMLIVDDEEVTGGFSVISSQVEVASVREPVALSRLSPVIK